MLACAYTPVDLITKVTQLYSPIIYYYFILVRTQTLIPTAVRENYVKEVCNPPAAVGIRVWVTRCQVPLHFCSISVAVLGRGGGGGGGGGGVGGSGN